MMKSMQKTNGAEKQIVTKRDVKDMIAALKEAKASGENHNLQRKILGVAHEVSYQAGYSSRLVHNSGLVASVAPEVEKCSNYGDHTLRELKFSYWVTLPGIKLGNNAWAKLMGAGALLLSASATLGYFAQQAIEKLGSNPAALSISSLITGGAGVLSVLFGGMLVSEVVTRRRQDLKGAAEAIQRIIIDKLREEYGESRLNNFR